MTGIIHTRMEEISPKSKGNGEAFGYKMYPALPEGTGKHCHVSFYEIPPGKSNYPYHYHLSQEETFFIISGTGLLKTPEGDREVRPGDLLFFPGGAEGAHKLTNPSKTDPLVYLDFDTTAEIDVAVYPDSDKVGIWSPALRKVFRAEDNVDYYDRE